MRKLQTLILTLIALCLLSACGAKNNSLPKETNNVLSQDYIGIASVSAKHDTIDDDTFVRQMQVENTMHPDRMNSQFIQDSADEMYRLTKKYRDYQKSLYATQCGEECESHALYAFEHGESAMDEELACKPKCGESIEVLTDEYVNKAMGWAPL